MKTIGLVGGMSWASSAEYYKLINEGVHERLGGLNYARCILYSFNFEDIHRINQTQDWPTALRLVTQVCRHLSAAGAGCIVLCANSMYLLAEDLARNIDIPIIHIAEATAEAIAQQGQTKVGLLGTRFTMEMDFFKQKLSARNIGTVIPSATDREFIHSSIFDELGKGIFQESTKRRYIDIIIELASRGAEGIVLGCTEIPLLLKPPDSPLPLFDTITIHANAAVRFALQEDHAG